MNYSVCKEVCSKGAHTVTFNDDTRWVQFASPRQNRNWSLHGGVARIFCLFFTTTQVRNYNSQWGTLFHGTFSTDLWNLTGHCGRGWEVRTHGFPGQTSHFSYVAVTWTGLWALVWGDQRKRKQIVCVCNTYRHSESLGLSSSILSLERTEIGRSTQECQWSWQMEKIRLRCSQPSDRGWLEEQNRTSASGWRGNVLIRVCLSVREQDNLNSYGRIFRKFRE